MSMCVDSANGRDRGTNWVCMCGLYEGKIGRHRVYVCV